MKIEFSNFWKPTKIKLLFISLSFLVCLGCKTQHSTVELESVFVQKELKDIESIRQFFVKDIMHLNDENFHNEFRNKIYKLEANGLEEVNPKKLNQLFNSISESTFSKIWEVKTITKRSDQINYSYLVPNPTGQYLEFLKKNTKHNSQIATYYDEILKAGKFSHMAMLNYLSDDSLDFDLHNKNIQTVLAIHYISILHDNNITSK